MPSPLALDGLGFLILLVYGLISSTPDYGRVSSPFWLGNFGWVHCFDWAEWMFSLLLLYVACSSIAVDVALDMSGVLLVEDFFVYCGLFVAALCSLRLPSFTWTVGDSSLASCYCCIGLFAAPLLAAAGWPTPSFELA
uniref:Uncharacterized protein n=1 Tax=Populus alba TaxID=43335 RepID=A0A4U5P5K5_POPAL|nr:hypothetical protein D5086_0000222100 [Populus alba]